MDSASSRLQSNPHGSASVWIVMGADNEKKKKVNNVYTDIPSIQSRQDSKVDIDGLCDDIDCSTNATKCDEMPIDAGSAKYACSFLCS